MKNEIKASQKVFVFDFKKSHHVRLSPSFRNASDNVPPSMYSTTNAGRDP